MVVKVDIQKTRGGLYWTNRYLLDVADPADVSDAMLQAIADAEGNWHATTVNFVSARVSDMVPNTDNFRIYPLAQAGAQNDGGNAIPGFVTLRCDMGVGPGRPLRKYYRTYAAQALITNGVYSSTFLSGDTTVMEDLLEAIPSICDPQGNRATSVAFKQQVQMRQLRRGSRKQATPVIPVT